MDVLEYMYLKGGVCVDAMLIEVSGYCGVIVYLDVIEMVTKSFDYGIFCFSYISTLDVTNVAGDRIYQIATLAIGFGDSSVSATAISIFYGTCVANFGAIPASIFSVAAFLFWGVPQGWHLGPYQFVL